MHGIGLAWGGAAVAAGAAAAAGVDERSAHGGSNAAHRQRGHGCTDVLHGIIDGQPSGDHAAGGVDIHANLRIGRVRWWSGG